MSTALIMYDPNLYLDELADLAGDFDAKSFEATERWRLRQWRRYADALGFRGALDRHLARKSRKRTLVNGDGLRAFAEWHRRQVHRQRDPELARVRFESLKALRKLSPSNTWLTEVDAQRLPEGGCFTPLGMRGEEVGPLEVRQRKAPPRDFLALIQANASRQLEVQPRVPAFRSDVVASMYHDRDDRRPEGCKYILKLSLGTWPYVYGRQLSSPAPGLLWAPSGEWSPAVEGMRTASAFWTQTGNLRQDARVVLRQYKRFRKMTAIALDRKVPGARDPRSGELRQAIPRLVTPRASIDATGYNLVLRSFAAFFAARRAFLNAPRAFSPATYRAIEANPDPVLRDTLGI